MRGHFKKMIMMTKDNKDNKDNKNKKVIYNNIIKRKFLGHVKND